MKTKSEIEQRIELLEGVLGKLLGIELLEYHDQNYLAFDNAKRSEMTIRELSFAQEVLGTIKRDVLREPEVGVRINEPATSLPSGHSVRQG